jgi:hypothetical protein
MDYISVPYDNIHIQRSVPIINKQQRIKNPKKKPVYPVHKRKIKIKKKQQSQK